MASNRLKVILSPRILNINYMFRLRLSVTAIGHIIKSNVCNEVVNEVVHNFSNVNCKKVTLLFSVYQKIVELEI